MTEADTALFFGRESILLAPLLLTFPGSRIATQYVSFASNNVCISNRKQPLDFSVLDKHYGTIQQWRSTKSTDEECMLWQTVPMAREYPWYHLKPYSI
jgi:hypothetical protein